MQTKNETALEAIRIAKAEIRRMREELVTEEELSDAKDYLTGSFPLRFDTNRKSRFLGTGRIFPIGVGLSGSLSRSHPKSDARRCPARGQTYLKPETLITVIVANQKRIGDQ